MNFLSFLINLGWLVSVDCFVGFILYVSYNYFDNKYNSKLEINVLKSENDFLKNENRKISITSTNNSDDFWGERRGLKK